MSRGRKDIEAFKTSMRGPSPNPTSTKKRHSSSNPTKELPTASPSASVLLISPTNQILLLHRVSSSTTFASAHVFPGGLLSLQDGDLPPPTDIESHEDSLAYRNAAIRECFEESGILLARRREQPGELVELTERERNEGRKAVHSEHVPFVQWVEEHGGELDTGNLIPFTRWLTPADITKRFSTQMYIYFLPIGKLASQMHLPTPDGGVEHTAATFASPQEWLGAALTREIVLFPPQFFLLWLVGDFLKQGHGTLGMDGLEEQRYRLIQFVESGDPPWGEKCISPNPVKMVGDTLILGMGGAGPEVKESARKGDEERVLRVELAEDLETGGRRSWPKEVLMKRDVFKDGKWNL